MTRIRCAIKPGSLCPGFHNVGNRPECEAQVAYGAAPVDWRKIGPALIPWGTLGPSEGLVARSSRISSLFNSFARNLHKLGASGGPPPWCR